MYAGAPVLAADSGGPLETVRDGTTGFLRPPNPAAFAAVMRALVTDPGLGLALGRAAHRHVVDTFGMEAFAVDLDAALARTVLDAQGRAVGAALRRAAAAFVLAVVVVAATALASPVIEGS
jgi:alpha-1,3/alpha-1,6-mannosyltransferase